MPLDTSIALNANAPQPTNPLQQALQVAQYRAYNANGLAAQQQLDANNAASDAFKQATDASGNTDYNKFRSIMAGSGVGYNLPQINKSILDSQQAQQTLDRGAIGLSNDKIDNANKMFGAVTQRLGTLDPNDPQFAAHAMDLGHQLVNQFGVDPQMVIHELANIPQDPAGRAQWRNSALASMQSAGEQLKSMTAKPTLVDNGGTQQYVDTNPITNPGVVGQSFNKTMTPTEATSQVAIQKPDGTTVTVPKAYQAQQQGQGGLVAPNAQPQQNMGDGRYGSAGPTNPEFQTTQPAGTVEASQKANAAGGDMLTSDRASNAQSGQRVNMLQNAGDALSKAQTGTGADKLNAVRGVVAMLGGPADKVASYDEANKYLTQYAQNKAASFGNGTDAQLSAAISGNGNTHISNLAAQDVVKVNLGLERMDQARMQAWDQSGLPASQYAQWKSKWGSSMDPRVFVTDQMDPGKAQAMIGKMNTKEQAQFKTQYNWAVKNGYINGPQ